MGREKVRVNNTHILLVMVAGFLFAGITLLPQVNASTIGDPLNFLNVDSKLCTGLTCAYPQLDNVLLSNITATTTELILQSNNTFFLRNEYPLSSAAIGTNAIYTAAIQTSAVTNSKIDSVDCGKIFGSNSDLCNLNPDTNVTTICSGEEVLLGNGTCMLIEQIGSLHSFTETTSVNVTSGTGTAVSALGFDYMLTDVIVTAPTNVTTFNFEAYKTTTGDMVDTDRKNHQGKWHIQKSVGVDTDTITMDVTNASVDGTYEVRVLYVK